MTQKFYDLTQPFYSGIPLWPWPVMYDTEITRVTFPEYATFPGDPKRGRVNKMTTVIKTKMHASTHMDAPLHVLEGGLTVDNIPLSSCYGEGVVVDMRYLKKWDVIGRKAAFHIVRYTVRKCPSQKNILACKGIFADDMTRIPDSDRDP